MDGAGALGHNGRVVAIEVPSPKRAPRKKHPPGDRSQVRSLLAWYAANKRELPWRQSPTPYGVWISEIIAQQTRMETAVPRWHAFMRRFATLSSLAQASENEVCEAWAGLGYYARARNLHRAARILIEQHDGAWPQTAQAWQQLPGVGPYTAGAIASTVFGEAAPLVDGNVIRVLARARLITQPATTSVGRAAFWRHAQTLVEEAARHGKPGDFNQGLMELGALVCLPRAPKCEVCPWQRSCRARQEGVALQLPVKVPAKAPVAMRVTFAVHLTANGVLLWRRPLSGLWSGLWEPPSAVGDDGVAVLRQRGYALGRRLGVIDHVLSHRLVRAELYLCEGEAPPAPGETHRRSLAPLKEPLSGLARKALALAAALGVVPERGAA